MPEQITESSTSFRYPVMQALTTSVIAALMLSFAAGTTAQAQTACAQTSTTGYRSDTGTGTVEKRAATETQLATTFTYGGYTSAANNTPSTGTINDIFQLTSAYSAQLDGRALVWRENNTAVGLASGTTSSQTNTATPYKSTVTLTFSREVSNLTLVIQDIDKGTLAGNGGSDYTDEVDFYPTSGSGTATDISSSGAVAATFGAAGTSASSTTCAYLTPFGLDGVTQVGVRGTGLNGGATANPSRTGNVTITFANPVKVLQLTFRNLNTLSSSQLRLQTIGIEQLSWCAQADLTTTITNASSSSPTAGSTGKFNVTFSNVGDLTTSGVVAQVQLPKNLTNVTATNGGTYSASTGLVTYSSDYTAAIAPYLGVLASVISYTAPAAGTIVTATSSVTTATSQGLNPNADNATATVKTVAPLPVTLTGFDVKAAGADAQVSWTTASEANNSYFAVERSFDGTTFAELSRVAGQGTTTTTHAYTYLDANVARQTSGVVYYRLRQVDLDGTATYSPVRTLSVAATGTTATLGLYPNPSAASDATLTLDLLTLPQGTYQASLLSISGTTLATYSVQGAEQQAVNLPATLPTGTYVVLVSGNGLHLTQRLARQ